MPVRNLSAGQETGQDTRQPEKVTIIVHGQDGRTLGYLLPRTTRLGRLFTNYCKRKDMDLGTVSFYYKGKRINRNQTPDLLNWKDWVEIDAMVMQTGA